MLDNPSNVLEYQQNQLNEAKERVEKSEKAMQSIQAFKETAGWEAFTDWVNNATTLGSHPVDGAEAFGLDGVIQFMRHSLIGCGLRYAYDFFNDAERLHKRELDMLIHQQNMYNETVESIKKQKETDQNLDALF